MIKFLDLTSQYKAIKSEIDLAITSVINSSAFIGGKFVRTFEDEFAQYQEAKHCVGVGNGTDALEIAIESLDLDKGEIIVPANSFVATSEAVTRTGHQVVFCDVDPTTFTMTLEHLKKHISPKTVAVIPVHLYGHPCDMDPIVKFCNQNGIRVIEDCAQAHGAEYKGKRVGTIGDLGAFSFYPGKNLGAYGDGGAILTNDDQLAKRCRMIGNHGRIEKYNHLFDGRNSRLDGIQAAILSVKLKYLDQWTKKRINIASKYNQSLGMIKGITLPTTKEWAKHVFHLYVIRCDDRDKIKFLLKERDVQFGVHYPISLSQLPAYQKRYVYVTSYCDKLSQQILSLPIGDHLKEQDVEFIASVINNDHAVVCT